MKNLIKYILILTLIIIGCNDSKQNKLLNNVGNNSEKVKIRNLKNEIKIMQTSCLDTIKLNMLGIKHYRTKNTKNKEWVISKRNDFQENNLQSINYYYSTKSKDNCEKPINYFTIDSLILNIRESNIQTIKLPKFESSSTFSQLETPNSRLIDINFDGFTDFDLALNEVSGATNEIRRYYVFNPLKGQFEKGIDFANMRIDTVNNLIYNSWNGGHAGKISTRTWSEIRNYKELKMVKNIKSDYNKKIDSYIVERTELINKDEYSVHIDTIAR